MKIDMPEIVLENMRSSYHGMNNQIIRMAFIKTIKLWDVQKDSNLKLAINGEIFIHQYIDKSLPLIDENKDVYKHLCILNKAIEKSNFGKKDIHSLVNVDYNDPLGYVRGYVEFWHKIFALRD